MGRVEPPRHWKTARKCARPGDRWLYTRSRGLLQRTLLWTPGIALGGFQSAPKLDDFAELVIRVENCEVLNTCVYTLPRRFAFGGRHLTISRLAYANPPLFEILQGRLYFGIKPLKDEEAFQLRSFVSFSRWRNS
jgi:hypothetical protein